MAYKRLARPFFDLSSGAIRHSQLKQRFAKKALELVDAFEGEKALSSVIKIPNISKTFKSIEKMLTVKEDQFPKIAASID